MKIAIKWLTLNLIFGIISLEAFAQNNLCWHTSTPPESIIKSQALKRLLPKDLKNICLHIDRVDLLVEPFEDTKATLILAQSFLGEKKFPLALSSKESGLYKLHAALFQKGIGRGCSEGEWASLVLTLSIDRQAQILAINSLEFHSTYIRNLCENEESFQSLTYQKLSP